MNETQKIITALTFLLVIAVVVIYVPIRHTGLVVSSTRSFLFSKLPMNSEIDMKKLVSELLVIIFLGAGVVILLGLKKKK